MMFVFLKSLGLVVLGRQVKFGFVIFLENVFDFNILNLYFLVLSGFLSYVLLFFIIYCIVVI